MRRSLFAIDEGIADIITEKCSPFRANDVAPMTKDEFTACVLSVLQEREHNKFFQTNHKFKKGDLKNIVTVEIRDERGYLAEKDVEPRKKIQFTTTQGKYDPDSLRWYAVIEPIDKDEDSLILVKR